jgi:hypothetical protein
MADPYAPGKEVSPHETLQLEIIGVIESLGQLRESA